MALASLSDVVVIVDVFSFSTCVEIAVSRGAVVFPFVWQDARATAFARDIGAELAGPRGQTRFSLSPASFLHIAPGTCVVLLARSLSTVGMGMTSAWPWP